MPLIADWAFDNQALLFLFIARKAKRVFPTFSATDLTLHEIHPFLSKTWHTWFCHSSIYQKHALAQQAHVFGPSVLNGLGKNPEIATAFACNRKHNITSN
jgi:hypothetical protein